MRERAADDPHPCAFSLADADPWINGNLNGSKAHYREDEVVPFRMKLTGLTPGSSNTITIEWDTLKSGKHAYDFIYNYNYTETDADPCVGIAGCSLASVTYKEIPQGPDGPDRLHDDRHAQQRQRPRRRDGDVRRHDRRDHRPVASGRHRRPGARHGLLHADRQQPRSSRGAATSPTTTTGAPARQPRTSPARRTTCGSSSSTAPAATRTARSPRDAIFFPSTITIVKDAAPNDAQDFAFTTTGGLDPANFSLDDDADGTLSNTQTWPPIVSETKDTYTVTEQPTTGWTLDDIVCTTVAAGSADVNDHTIDVDAGEVAIPLDEGEDITCTYFNDAIPPELTVIKHVINDNGGTATAGQFTMNVDDPGTNPPSFPGAESPGTTVAGRLRARTASRSPAARAATPCRTPRTATARSRSARRRPARSPTTTSRRS